MPSSAADAAPGGLVALVRNRILGILTSVQPAQSKWKVLVTDPKALKVINSACKLQEILDADVTLVEDITRRRQPYQNKDAVYILSPTAASVDGLIADFGARRLYAAAHIYFIASLPDELFNRIKASPIAPFIRCLKEVLVDFVPAEARAFSLDEPLSMFTMYNVDPSLEDRRVGMLRNLARRLVSTLATLGEYPYIRYYNATGKPITLKGSNATDGSTDSAIEKEVHEATKDATSSPAALFAHMVQHGLDELCRLDDAFPPRSDYARGVLIVTDRMLDLISPLVHEYTYQALTTDVLRIEDGKYMNERERGDADPEVTSAEPGSAVSSAPPATTGGSSSKQKIIIDESDQIYTLIRHWHFVDAVDYIKNAFQEFLSQNKAAQGALGRQSELSGLDAIKQMKETLFALPEFQEVKAKFSVHINICQECSTMFERNETQIMSGLEQDLVTGELADGSKLKQTTIMMNMLPILDNNTTPIEDKLRLLLIYAVINDGIEEEERKQLLGYAHMTPINNQALVNLTLMGIQVGKPGSTPNTTAKPISRGKYKYRTHRDGRGDPEAKYDVSRWVPLVKSVVEDHVSNNLDSNLFPWTTMPPSVAEAERQQKEEANQSVFTKAATKLNFSRKDPSLIPPDSTRPFSLRTTRPTWTKKRDQNGGDLFEKATDAVRSDMADSPSALSPIGGGQPQREPRIIVFSLGGVCYSEIRSIYELSLKFNREMYIGGSFIYSPHQFVECLKELHKSDPFGNLPSKWANLPEHKMDLELLDKEYDAKEAEKLKEIEKTKANVKKDVKSKKGKPETKTFTESMFSKLRG